MNKVQFELLQAMSGEFLAKPYPDEWESMKGGQKRLFVLANIIESMEEVGSLNITKMIEGCAITAYEYILNAIEEDKG